MVCIEAQTIINHVIAIDKVILKIAKKTAFQDGFVESC